MFRAAAHGPSRAALFTFQPETVMKLLAPFTWSLLALASVPSLASAQTNGALPTAQSVYSLYVARHAATVRFAELGTRSSNEDVRKLAELLQKQHTEAGEKLTELAAKEGVSLSRPAHDTTDAMLARATRLLGDTNATAFDSTFAVQAYGWLSTLILSNNVNVSHPLPEGDLKKFAQAYTSFLFREMVEAGKVKSRFEKK
jgi:predicted outer membrane protein